MCIFAWLCGFFIAFARCLIMLCELSICMQPHVHNFCLGVFCYYFMFYLPLQFFFQWTNLRKISRRWTSTFSLRQWRDLRGNIHCILCVTVPFYSVFFFIFEQHQLRVSPLWYADIIDIILVISINSMQSLYILFKCFFKLSKFYSIIILFFCDWRLSTDFTCGQLLDKFEDFQLTRKHAN